MFTIWGKGKSTGQKPSAHKITPHYPFMHSKKIKLLIANLRNQTCTHIIPVILEPAGTWGYTASWFRRLCINWLVLREKPVPLICKMPWWFGPHKSANKCSEESTSLSGCCHSHHWRICWRITSPVSPRTSALREAILKGMAKLDKVGMRDLRAAPQTVNGRTSAS